MKTKTKQDGNQSYNVKRKMRDTVTQQNHIFFAHSASNV